MGRHFFCDVCRSADPTKKDVTVRAYRIEDEEFLIHLDSHSKLELILYAKSITNELYETRKYEVKE